MTLTKPILLAEDNPRDAELALAAMEEHHLADKVILCHDGAEVLDYLYCRGHFKARLQGNPAVVLLDLKMPKVDGLEVLRTIKSDAALKPIPVVMLTSSRESGTWLKVMLWAPTPMWSSLSSFISFSKPSKSSVCSGE